MHSHFYTLGTVLGGSFMKNIMITPYVQNITIQMRKELKKNFKVFGRNKLINKIKQRGINETNCSVCEYIVTKYIKWNINKTQMYLE